MDSLVDSFVFVIFVLTAIQFVITPILIYALFKCFRTLDRHRTELMKMRARMNTYIEKGNSYRVKQSPFVSESKPAEFDFTIFDLDDPL
jgi:hypothetical protein